MLMRPSRRAMINVLGLNCSAVGLMTLPTRTVLGETHVQVTSEVIILGGFAERGDKGAGALYVRGIRSGPMAIADANGNWWNLCIAQEVWAGWFGVLGVDDDTESLQFAIDCVASLSNGGTVRIASGTYKIANGTRRASLFRGLYQNSDELSRELCQAYCLNLPNGVKLEGENGTKFVGTYRFGSADLDQPACICCTQEPLVENIGVSNIVFESFFIAIGIFKPNTVVLSEFVGNVFIGCGIGLYSRGLERCRFEWTRGQGTGALIVTGGQWATYKNEYSEGGGFSDKTSFGDIHNVYGREFGSSEASIDAYFDRFFFKTRHAQGSLEQSETKDAIQARFPYLGICGRAVYLMARHARPNNANSFGLVTHSYAPRAAIWIDSSIACVARVVYLEGCGYRDNVKRLDAIGKSFSDPYLGLGKRVPAFVHGVSCPIDAQFVYAEALNTTRDHLESTFGCDLVNEK